MTEPITARLADWATAVTWDALPAEVRIESVRCFVNFIGCTLGGCRHPAVETVLAATAPFAGAPQASLLGRSDRLDLPNVALLNCMASAVHTFDDTHLNSISHP